MLASEALLLRLLAGEGEPAQFAAAPSRAIARQMREEDVKALAKRMRVIP
jgi:hypothetical protein